MWHFEPGEFLGDTLDTDRIEATGPPPRQGLPALERRRVQEPSRIDP
jgi:hypothetical protein